MTSASLKALCWFEKKQTVIDLNCLETNEKQKKPFYSKYRLQIGRVTERFQSCEVIRNSLSTSTLSMIGGEMTRPY